MKKIFITGLALLMLPLATYSQTLDNIDEIAPFSEGLAAVRKNDKWAFIDKEGTIVINFRDDIYWNGDADSTKEGISGIRYPMFKDGRCIVKKIVEDNVPVYGFMDTKGDIVIEPQFLNVFPFKDGYTTGVVFEKTLKGQNEFNLNIYEFKFHDVLMDTSGEIEEFFQRRYNIQMTSRRYSIPMIGVKRLADGLVAIHSNDQGWSIRKLTL